MSRPRRATRCTPTSAGSADCSRRSTRRGYRQAAAAYRRAEGIAHDLGDRFQEGMILDHLGDSHDAAGEVDAACAAWRRAMHILSGLGHPDAETVRVKLGQRERTDR